jgi:hypothetical protein
MIFFAHHHVGVNRVNGKNNSLLQMANMIFFAHQHVGVNGERHRDPAHLITDSVGVGLL